MSSEASSIPQRASMEAATQTGLVAASDLRPGDILAGRFRIEALLGMGGMGVVYRANDLSLDIDVAIKLLRPELARKPEAFERFRQELLLARQVSSPYVVRIHDIAQHQGRWFISMDYVPGESLEHRLDNHGKLPLEEAIGIARGLLDGLAAAHARGVVHRDLKPANVLIDPQGRPTLTDFGVARSLGATGATQSGVIVGTPEYLSPEQARGEAVDGRSDLYATGLILYEMLAGTLPFAGGTPAETVIQRLVRPPPSLSKTRPDLPGWIHAFCQRLLMMNPAHRFANATEALRALEARRVPRPPVDRRVWLVGALAICVIAGATDWARRQRQGNVVGAPAIVALPSVPRVAVLPFETDAADAATLGADARLIEEDLRQWLRADPGVAVVPRRRVQDALARAAPGLHGDALARQLVEVGRAATASVLWRGHLASENGRLRLQLTRTGTAGSASLQLQADGTDVDSLLQAYRQAVSAVENNSARTKDFPVWNRQNLSDLGSGLQSLDHRDYDGLARALAPLGAEAPLPAQWLLEAQTALHQELPAQATRRAIVARFANANDLASRQVLALAIDGNGDGSAAAKLWRGVARDFPHDADIALQASRSLIDAGDGAAAQTLLEAQVADDPQDTAAWFALGKNAIQQGQAQAAVDDYLLRALVLSTRAGDTRSEADVRNALGVGYERLGQLDAAIDQYDNAALLRERNGDKAGLATTLRNLAVVQAVHGDRAAAEKSLDRAGALLQGLGDRTSLADLANDRGVIAEERGDYTAALAAYRDALALRQQLDLSDGIAQSLNNIGFANYQLGAFDDALVYWQQAQTAYEKLDDRSGSLHAEQSIGLLEIARGHFSVARQRLEGSLRAAEDHQLPEESAVAHTYLGELALTEGRYADAYAETDRAQAFFARRDDRRGMAETALQRARIALALGDGAAADSALASLPRDKLNPEQRAMFDLAQARRFALAGSKPDALRELDAATAAADTAHSGMLALEAAILRLRLALDDKDREAAKKARIAVRDAGKRIDHVPLRLSALELDIAVALRGGNAAEAATHYRQALDLLHRAGDWRDAALLHALGAKALGQGAEAGAATDAAGAARTALLDAAPAAARAALERELARRWQEDTGLAPDP